MYIQEFIEKKPEYVFCENDRPPQEKAVYEKLESFLGESYRVKLVTNNGILYERTK